MIWDAAGAEENITPIKGSMFRLVESQEQVATMGYVDTLEEQAILEEMLEKAKPPYAGSVDEYHYLLTTPFRYPPLKWGSRFGRVDEPSLFYAGCTPEVTLAESAYYRFVFLYSIKNLNTNDKIRSEHTLFCVRYQATHGARLNSKAFAPWYKQLIDPISYSATQKIGHDMRNAGVKAFEYASSRDLRHGQCVALFDLTGFKDKTIRSSTQWLCETTLDEVRFKQFADNAVTRFSLNTFLVNGKLPYPAM